MINVPAQAPGSPTNPDAGSQAWASSVVNILPLKTGQGGGTSCCLSQSVTKGICGSWALAPPEEKDI